MESMKMIPMYGSFFIGQCHVCMCCLCGYMPLFVMCMCMHVIVRSYHRGDFPLLFLGTFWDKATRWTWNLQNQTARQQALRIWLSLFPPFSSWGYRCALLLSLVSLHGYWDQTQVSMSVSTCFAHSTISPAPSNTNKDKMYSLNHTVLFLEA